MRAKNTQAKRLGRVQLFSTCTTGQLRRIDSLMTHIQARAGQVLVREGCREGQFVVVLEGTASAFREGVLIGQLERGSFFGETARLDAREGTPKVVAETDMELCVASRREFRCLRGVIPGVLENVGRARITRAPTQWPTPPVMAGPP